MLDDVTSELHEISRIIQRFQRKNTAAGDNTTKKFRYKLQKFDRRNTATDKNIRKNKDNQQMLIEKILPQAIILRKFRDHKF